jgi:hypothetical protein
LFVLGLKIIIGNTVDTFNCIDTIKIKQLKHQSGRASPEGNIRERIKFEGRKLMKLSIPGKK